MDEKIKRRMREIKKDIMWERSRPSPNKNYITQMTNKLKKLSRGNY
jgi:hypothetical protein